MFASLHRQTRILIIAMFLSVCSIAGLLLSIAINTVFPKNAVIAEIKSPIIPKNTAASEKNEELEKKEEVMEEEKSNSTMTQDSSDDDTQKFVVGKDIQGGVYKLYTNGDIGSYKISDAKSSAIGDERDIMYFNFAYIYLKDGQTLTIENSRIVKESEISPYTDEKYIDGQYKVGFDIKSGKYNIRPVSGVGKLEILSDIKMKNASSIEYVDSPITVEFKDNQYITLTNLEIVR